MKPYKFTLYRDNYQGLTTLGYIKDNEGCHYCYTLEDVVRPYGIKDFGMTAIPATEPEKPYRLKVMPSGKYGEAVTIYTHLEGAKPILSNGGIRFEYIRCHGGNKHEHSHGCILVNKHRSVENMSANGSMLKDFVASVKDIEAQGYECYLEVINLPQKG